ncbi:MAG: SIMPL domain-containing protein [Rhizobiaceae bacterium]
MISRISAITASAFIMHTALALQPALADDKKPATISVTATGQATVAPDMAILNFAVVRQGKTAREALNANTIAMGEVLAALKQEGIADRDLQTSNFNIQPRYHYTKRNSSGEQKPPQIIGYQVTNGLIVRIRKLEILGNILDTVVTLGVNSGGGVSFTSDNPDKTIEVARKNAMINAIAKAKTLTGAAGIKLGRILEISEQNHGRPRPQAMGRMVKSMAADEAMAVPVASGENSYSITVNVRWELAQ